VYVIQDDKQKNAFVVPGGKIFVFTGILPVTANKDGLATVLGHEVAHVGKYRRSILRASGETWGGEI
jgi:predicted Zn-dependent protease